MSDALWPDAIGRLLRREELPRDLTEQVMSAILSGDATDAQIAGFAVAMRTKGETPTELATLVRTMLRFAERVDLPSAGGPIIDTCGTGGDRAGTVNVSTMAALVAASAGARVAKHGGRAASSRCGSADVLEALGVVIDLGPEGVARCVDEAGIGFCFAPRYHAGLRFAAPARRELGTPTTFNFVAPLANPAGVKRQIVGVSDPTMAERLIAMLADLGAERALVFYGHDGLDELTVTTTSTIHELRDGSIDVYELDPTTLGIPRAQHRALAGGDAAGNAEVVHQVVAGASGPIRDIVALNSAAALLVADLVPDLAAGVKLAGEILDDGRAAATLDALVRVSVAAREAGN
ncbi:MAG TPA: anthranilate phosphoribosyltransferase [Acidimicrobiia bacterium]|jgi:anthranilate phosphoribosyltransferase